jgi:cytochrome c oxidase assembly factor 2
MVAHLHPRSRSTMSLFSGCLAICFAVVAAPHVLPCPVDKTQLADSASPDGEPRRRRRRKQSTPPPNSDRQDENDMNDINAMARPKRECPVPKPSGLIGQVMGFKPQEQRQNPTIIIQTLRDRHSTRDADSSDKSL